MAIVLLLFSSTIAFVLSLVWVLVTEGTVLSFLLAYAVSGNTLFTFLLFLGHLIRHLMAARRARIRSPRPLPGWSARKVSARI